MHERSTHLTAFCLGLLLLAWHAPALGAPRSYDLRWIAPIAGDLAGYRVYLRYPSGSWGSPQDLGMVKSGVGRVAQATISLQYGDQDYRVAMTAYDKTGNESKLSNELLIARLATTPPPTSPPPGGGLLLNENFELWGASADPKNWYDTGRWNGRSQSEEMFKTSALNNGTLAFGTEAQEKNVHSHYVGSNATGWRGYEFSGRMLFSDMEGGIGVTFLSDYPRSDNYWRLRSYEGDSFHLSPRGTHSCVGTTDSGVTSKANLWYHFRVRVDGRGTSTRMQARVWAAGQNEPAAWQIDCVESGSMRLQQGTVGLWATEEGAKYWDDLVVVDGSGANSLASSTVPAAPAAPDVCHADADCDDGDRWNGSETCDAGSCSAGTPRQPGAPMLLN